MHYLRDQLSQYWRNIQGNLFPWLEEELGPLTEKLQLLVSILDMARIECFIKRQHGWPGRPPEDRVAIARAFIAKSVLNLPTTRAVIDRLKCDIQLRRICGWEGRQQIPSESTFSRAFMFFSESELPLTIHETIITQTHENRIVGHISRDSTAISAREKPVKKSEPEQKKKTARKRGRPKKDEQREPKEPTLLEKQLKMSTCNEMMQDISTHCDVGTKINSKGYKTSWTGYKLHIDCADGQIPISCLVTSASVHDSQVAIPLATKTAERVQSCYDLMDSAYDASEIKKHSEKLGHVPIIDVNPRRNKALKEELAAEKKRMALINIPEATKARYNERTTAERVNARLKDEFGGRTLRVRGHIKVACHLGFGILALTVDQLLRFAKPGFAKPGFV